MSLSMTQMRAGPAARPAVTATAGKAVSSKQAIACAKPFAARISAKASRRSVVQVSAAAEEEGEENFDARAFRRTLVKSENYKRNVSNNSGALELMEEEGIGATTKGGLVSEMRETGFMAQIGDVKIKLAESYGFCWGVERAVQMAYEARKQYPDEKLWITNEIIHNPTVNQRLKEMEVNFIEAQEGQEKDFSGVKKGDVVILPAFGASVQEMKLLDERKVNIVDTTCPWVSKVWNAVDMHKKKSYTSIIHGKWQHEETVATASFAGDYLVVKNMKEADYVRNYILNGGDRAEFLEKFKNAYSVGFDPDTMLGAVGLANQTTMLKGETEALGKLLEKTMMEKYGVAELQEHFMILDTICDATQERQDAMYKLVEPEEKLDMMLVVGGFNSSNTSHLQEIAEDKNIPSYWVDTKDRVLEGNKVEHLMHSGELVTTEGWLKEGPITIGVTSGASTPDKVVEDILEVIFRQKDEMAKVAA